MAQAKHVFVLAILMLLPTAVCGAQSQGESDSWIDRDLFPEAYGILTSERVMFPDNVSDWPLKIGTEHQLFVDDYLISKTANLTRQFHQPVKHPDNPLMPGGSVGVLHDADKGVLRMWNGVRYFTSTDGVLWDAPDVGPEGNVVFREWGDLRGFMHNPDLPQEEGRYKAVLERRYNAQTGEQGGFYVYHSRDGLHWERRSEEPVLRRTVNCMLPAAFRSDGAGDEALFQWTNPDRFQSNGAGDTSSFRYDTKLKRYICDGKFNVYMPPEKFEELEIVSDGKSRLRLRTFSESEDLMHWSPPRFILYPDRMDPPDRQIYAHVGFEYESMWLGIIQTMRHAVTGWKQVDLQLSYSRDGRHWLRPDQREPFIPLGPADSWDADYSGAPFTGPVLVGDELFFYYFSSRNPARDNDPDGDWPVFVGLATLRRDGFASLNAGDTPGHVVTRPLQFGDNRLYVNADVEPDGWVKAAVLTRDAEPIAGRTLADAIALTENTTSGQMAWSDGKELPSSANGHVRLQFEIKNARLYSFWIE